MSNFSPLSMMADGGDAEASKDETVTPTAKTTDTTSKSEDQGDLSSSLKSILGINQDQLSVGSGQGRFGDYGATITPEQAQALAKQAGIDLGSSSMQAITVSGNPNTAGLTITPELELVASEGGGYLPTGNYIVSYQPDYMGKLTAIAQTKPDFDPTQMFINIALSSMGVPAWALSAGNAAYAVSQGASPLDVAKQALTSYAINTGMQGISPGTAGSVSNTIGSALDLTPEQISSMKDTLTFKGAVPSVVGPLEQAVGVTPGSLADKAITGATKGAISAAIQGKDISEGAVSGLVSAGMKGVSSAAKSGLEDVKGALSTPIGTSSGDTGAPEEETYKQPPLPYVTSVDEDGTKHYNDGTTVYPDNSVTRPANDFYGTPELRIDANGNYYTDGKLVSGPDFTEETGGLPSAQAKTDTTVDHLPAEQQVDVSGQKESGLDVLTPENKIVADTKGTLPPENQVVIPEKKLTEEETYPLDTVTTPKKETVTVDPYAKTPEQVVIPEKKLTEEETFPLDTVTTPKKETVTVDPYAKTPEQVVIPEKKLTDDTGDIDAGTITITAPKETVEIDPYKKTPDQIVVTGPKEPPELQPTITDPVIKPPEAPPIKTAPTITVPKITTPTSTPTGTPTPTALASSGGKDTGIPWLTSTPSMLYNMPNLSAYLAKEAAREKHKDILTQLEPSLAEEFRSRGYGEDNVEPTYGYASGGSTTSTSGLMDLSDPKSLPFVNTAPAMLQGSPVARRTPATPNPLRQLYSKMSSHDMGMAKGGLPHKYAEAAPDGHNPEFITGLTGYYASGGGTGQSDDIPAMLHDGDYVMDAETVSALGDGSSKAGREVLDGFRSKIPHRDRQEGSAVPAKIADGEYVFPAAFVTSLGNGDNKRGAKILDGLREKLREHKRSAPSTKIPPKAKSPLDYIKQAKG